METILLTIEIPKPHVAFLKDYAKRRNTTISKVIEQYIEHLQQESEGNVTPNWSNVKK